MIFSSYVAMDITSSEVRLLTIRGSKVKKWGSAPVPDGIVKDGVILDPRSLSVIVDGLFKSLKAPRNRVICDVTGLPFLYRTITMPGKEINIQAEAIERAARKEMSLVGEDMNLFWQSTGVIPESGDTNYFVLGVPKISFEPLVETLKAARIKPYVVGIKPLALARAASLDNACVASLEKNYFDIVLVANSLVRVIHSISPSVQADDQTGIVTDFVDAFNKAIKSFNRDYPQDPFAAETPILLSGEFAAYPELPGAIQEASGHPTTVVEPVLTLPPDIPPALYAGAAGLLLKVVHPKNEMSQYFDINMNLLETKRGKAKFGQPLAVAAVAIVIVILAGVTAQLYMMRSDKVEEVATLKQQAALGTQKLAAVQKINKDTLALKQPAADALAKVQAELASITKDNQQVVSKETDFAGRILGINGALPVGADYTKLDINATSVKVTGYARSALDTVKFGNSLEKEAIYPIAQITKISPSDWPEGVTYEILIPQGTTK